MRSVSRRLLAALVLWAACDARAPATAPPAVKPRAQALKTAAPIVASGSTWRYEDDGKDPPATWKTLDFDDRSWLAGPAQLGYGEGDEATVVGFGADPNQKYVTTWFRQRFDVDDHTRFANLIFRLLVDDGAVVYLNGVEVLRENMPAGPITSATLTPKTSVENLYILRNVDPKYLVDGHNVLAVEVHQAARDSSDLSFDLEVTGSEDLVLTRGPYLQMGSWRSALVRWRTDLPSDSRVRYGASPTSLTTTAQDATPTIEHAVELRNLRPATRYYYAIGTKDGTLAGGDSDTFFWTPPTPGTQKPTRVWVIGDAGLADINVAFLRDAYSQFAGDRYTDLWLMLGDNAYNEGTDDQYQKAVFDMFPGLLRQTFLWPTIGNHETQQLRDQDPGVYLRVFDLPMRAEAGGMASGTEKYYSFDYANIHFVCLDSMSSSLTPGSPMLTWLESDLKANTRTWLVAFWHHPPYTKGSHDSDAEEDLGWVRTTVVPVLERYGVDLVLNGHSHVYERSYLIDGHYGPSDTFDPSTMIKNAGSGRPGEGGAYAKTATGPAAHQGTVYVVAGSAARVADPSASLDHPAMYVSMNVRGSLVLDVDGLSLRARFLRETGAIEDEFVLQKGSMPSVPPAAPTGLSAMVVPGAVVRLSWRDQSDDEAGFRVERSTDGATFAQVAEVGANATTHLDRPGRGGRYWYRVRAFSSAGVSDPSNAVEARTPELPRDAGAAPDGAVVQNPQSATDGPAANPGHKGCSFGGHGGGAGALVLSLLALARLISARRAA